MGYFILAIVGLFLIIVALYIAAWLITAALLLFVLPALLVLLPAGALAGAVLASVVVLGTVAGAGSLRPHLVTPDDVEHGRAPLPALRDRRSTQRDRAWPSYLSAQRRVDLRTAWAQLNGALEATWRWHGRGWANEGLSPLRFAVLPIITLVLLAMSLSAVVFGAVLLAVAHVVLFVAWAGWILAVGGLRAVDALVRRLRRADASCPRCYHIAPRPYYACDRCGQVHRDVRPSRLGAVWRRCGCGQVLPTTVLRAARVLEPRCAQCGEPLRVDSGVITDVRLPVFGPQRAGKTRLLYAGLLALRDAAAQAGGRIDFVDDGSRVAFEEGAALIKSHGSTQKTDRGLLPAVTARLTLSRRRRGLVHLFDAAGEYFADREGTTELEFLDRAVGLVLVVDPLSIGSVADQLRAVARHELVEASPAVQDPEVAYQITTRRLRDYRVDTGDRWLAVAVVKADVLDRLLPSATPRPGHVRQWLVDAGMDNLVLSAERDFGRVRYFVVASIPEGEAGAGRSAAAPFDWLLSRRGLGIRVPDTDETGGQRVAGQREQRHEPANV